MRQMPEAVLCGVVWKALFQVQAFNNQLSVQSSSELEGRRALQEELSDF